MMRFECRKPKPASMSRMYFLSKVSGRLPNSLRWSLSEPSDARSRKMRSALLVNSAIG